MRHRYCKPPSVRATVTVARFVSRTPSSGHSSACITVSYSVMIRSRCVRNRPKLEPEAGVHDATW
ncbi:hypothetical protein FIBSPDRAFT_963295 [Athelia psychrophila]|uniref:Uncharacterized protein n=1 Tax=Athelia psychrophila TaxID=1759441 RepID=A0A165Z403_9AGAM|nr:hypothetical protein FIBSPDRAFT_963295 [Fibularhizoctonia sp. CBS 109695]